MAALVLVLILLYVTLALLWPWPEREHVDVWPDVNAAALVPGRQITYERIILQSSFCPDLKPGSCAVQRLKGQRYADIIEYTAPAAIVAAGSASGSIPANASAATAGGTAQS